MRRRAVVRRGPGLVGTVARTAVVAGTATAVAKGVSGSMDAKAEQRQMEAEQQAAAQQQASQQQMDIEQMKRQMAAQQAQQPPAAPASPAAPDIMTQLTQLGQMRQAGLLTDEEFAAAKAKLLGG